MDRSELEKRLQDGKKCRNAFKADTSNVLKEWLLDHMGHPYPTAKEKINLSKESGLERKQVDYWFTNKRKRVWKKYFQEISGKLVIEDKNS